MSRGVDYGEVSNLDKLRVPRDLLRRLIDASVVAVEDGLPFSLDPIRLGYWNEDENGNGARRMPSLEEMSSGLRGRWEDSVMEKMGLGTMKARERSLTRVVVDPEGSGDNVVIYRVPKKAKVRQGWGDTEGLRLYEINRDGGKDLLVGPATRKRRYDRVSGWLLGEGEILEDTDGVKIVQSEPCAGCVLAGRINSCRD